MCDDFLQGLIDKVSLSLFAASCVARIQPVIQRFGKTETVGIFQDLLCQLWEAESQPKQQKLLARLNAAPDASIDDPYHRGYYAMRALGILYDAIHVVCGELLLISKECADSLSDGMCSLANDLQYEADGSSLLGEDSELALQIRSIEIIKGQAWGRVERLMDFCQENLWSLEGLEHLP